MALVHLVQLAQHSLGSLCAKGFRDKSIGFRLPAASFSRDYVEANKWFTLAAKNGHSQSLRDRAIIAKTWLKDGADFGGASIRMLHRILDDCALFCSPATPNPPAASAV